MAGPHSEMAAVMTPVGTASSPEIQNRNCIGRGVMKMDDESIEIPAEMRREFEETFRGAYEKHKIEERRSFEIGTSFYDKLRGS